MAKPSLALLTEGFFEFKKSAGEGLCWVKGCSKPSKNDRCLCHMHEMRRWRAKAKRTADYCTLRDHAKARGIAFDISPEYWKGLTDAFGFYTAREDEVLTIDRVDATRGYVEGNLRVVTMSVNASKSHRERYLPEHVQHMLDRRRRQMQEENEKFLNMDHAEEPQEWDDQDLPYSEEPDDNCPF